jgi:hypothetical protein
VQVAGVLLELAEQGQQGQDQVHHVNLKRLELAEREVLLEVVPALPVTQFLTAKLLEAVAVLEFVIRGVPEINQFVAAVARVEIRAEALGVHPPVVVVREQLLHVLVVGAQVVHFALERVVVVGVVAGFLIPAEQGIPVLTQTQQLLIALQ